jgi:putative sigma-54 modulation protein
MELQFVAKSDAEISEEIQGYARKKIEKLVRRLPSIGSGKIEIAEEGTKSPDQRFVVQVTLDSRGTLVRAQEKAEDIRTAIDRIVDVLTGRIEKYKGRAYAKERGVSPLRQGATIKQENESPRKIVRSKQFVIKPMPLDEAASQMDLLGHDFFLFINAENDKVSLLYRRKDSNYGLIEPDMG